MYMQMPYPYPVYPPPTQGGSTIDELEKMMKFWKAWHKEQEEEQKAKKNSEKKGPEPRKFSKWEVMVLLCLFSPFIGPGYLKLLEMSSKGFVELISSITK